MSKQIKVVCLEEGSGNLVSSNKIEAAINQMLSQGWTFLQLTTGAVSYNHLVNTYAMFDFSDDRGWDGGAAWRCERR